MTEKEFKFRSHPADFGIIYSAMKNISLEMGLTMERTSRSPIYFSAHDFSTALFDAGGNLITLTEYIPVHICAAPFAIKAALKTFGDDVHPGDLILVNDPYTYDGGNHLPDWTIALPVFYHQRLWFWSINRAHMVDIGGGVPGGYNALATDCFAEGVRIPPIKIFEAGKLRKDVFDFVLANVRFPEVQRGDLWSMIGSARVGERRLSGILDLWGEEVMQNFILDLYEYTEFLMRGEIDKVPDGTYYGESSFDGPPAVGTVTVRCNTTIKGDSIIIDLTDSDPQVPRFYNSTIANTYSGVFIALMSSIGKTVKYRSEGAMRPVEIRTRPGTITHCVFPAPNVLCTLILAKQIIHAVWESLAKVIPEKTPAGWGGMAVTTFSGVDPRRNEGYASPDFLACNSGAGAIGDVDGWHALGTPIHTGGIRFPEIEVNELNYPARWTKWEFITDSPGAGKARGGLGVENEFVVEGNEMALNQCGEYFKTMPGPAIAGGGKPLFYVKQFAVHTNGMKEEISGFETYTLKKGERLDCLCQGGCGVGNPLDREVEKVRQDVIDEVVSPEKARKLYGVVIDPDTFEVDEVLTRKLRLKRRK